MSQSHPPSEDLFAYRDGELDAERRGLIEAHVLSCTACQARIDALSDVEGVLREQSGEPDPAYLDRLTDAVMNRVAKEPATGAAPAGAAAGAGAAASRRERAGRRRNFEDEPRGRAPGLPWPAIFSAVSAAAAVVVVVVLLFQNQSAWRRSPSVPMAQAPVRSEADAGRSAAPAEGEAAPDPEHEGFGAATETAEPDAETPPAGNEILAKSRVASPTPPAALGGAAGFKEKAGAAADEPAAVAGDDRAAGRADEVRTQSAAEALPDVGDRRLAAEKKAAEAPAKITGGASAPRQEATREETGPSSAPPGPGYDEVVARHGLPPLYDPLHVRPQALLRAEPDLRALYQSGAAGADSARLRIYLAEAARTRAGANLDAEAFDAIVHHYRRALQLARDPATARLARQRLEDFVARSAPNR